MELRIAMIGASGSGKTSFMSGLYHHFVHEKRHNDNFGIAPISDGGDTALAVKQFSNLAKIVVHGEFPLGTADSTNYKFQLTHNDSPVCLFDWMDYRGGAIEELFNESGTTPEDSYNVRFAIDNSDAVVIFVDAVQLIEYESNIKARKYSGILVANQLMEVLRQDYMGGKQLNILIVLTKCDASIIEGRWRENHYELLIKRAKDLLTPTIDICHSKRWKCAIAPTGVVGVGNVETEKIRSGSSSRSGFSNEILDDPEPFGQNAALFYLIGSILKNACHNSQQQIEMIRREVEEMLRNKGRLSDIWKKLRGKENVDQIVQIKINQMNGIQNTFRAYERPISIMFDRSMESVRLLNIW